MKFVYSEWNDRLHGRALSSFEKLLDLFMQILEYTAGDAAEALQWLTTLDERHNLTGDGEGIGDFIDEQRGSYGEYMVRAYGKNGRQSLNHVRDMFPELLDESLYSIRSEDVARLRDASQEKIRKLDSTPGKAAAKKRLRLGMAALDDCYEHGMRWGLVSRNPAREAGSPGSAVPGVSTLPSAEQR